MKKRLTILAVVAVLAMVAAGCAQKTCPAYRGSVAMAEVAE